MHKPAQSLITLLALAAFALSGEVLAQARGSSKDAHWADKKPADDREAAASRAKLEQAMREEEAERRKAEKKAAEAAERKRVQDEEKRKLAALEKQKQAERAKKEREARCVYKPVMTNADIEACRELAR